MAKLIEVQLEDGATLWMEVDESVEVPAPGGGFSPAPTRTTRSGDKKAEPALTQRFEAVEDVLRRFSSRTVKALREVAEANIDTVKLEFGISLGGEAGVPFVTKGKAESSVKVTVECSFDK